MYDGLTGKINPSIHYLKITQQFGRQLHQPNWDNYHKALEMSKVIM